MIKHFQVNEGKKIGWIIEVHSVLVQVNFFTIHADNMNFKRLLLIFTLFKKKHAMIYVSTKYNSFFLLEHTRVIVFRIKSPG